MTRRGSTERRRYVVRVGTMVAIFGVLAVLGVISVACGGGAPSPTAAPAAPTAVKAATSPATAAVAPATAPAPTTAAAAPTQAATAPAAPAAATATLSPVVASAIPTAEAVGTKTAPTVQAAATALAPTAVAAATAAAGAAGTPTTAGQLADAGKTVYSTSCAACHGNEGQGGIGPALAGPAANFSTFKNAQELLTFVSARMPLTSPGSLTPQQYMDVVTFALVANGVVSRNESLTAAKLESIKLSK